MTKDELRRKMKNLRREFLKKEDASDIIQEKILSMEVFLKSSCVCIYSSAFGEVNTNRLIEKAVSMKKKILMPRSNEDNTLSLVRYNGKFREGLFGIKEPDSSDLADYAEPDLIIVPGLAFARDGHRLGFGKGYYDRLLEKSNGYKIGICYSFQLMDKVPTESFDVPLDAIVTEKEVIIL